MTTTVYRPSYLVTASALTAESVTAALRGRWYGTYGKARCPAHDDQTPSLSISNGRDVPLVFKCHANCSFESIVQALDARGIHTRVERPPFEAPRIHPVTRNGNGLHHDDDDDGLIFPEPIKLHASTETYDYRDESGAVLYQKVRKPSASGGKEFYQQRPDGTRNLDGVRRVLYRLPELLAAPSDALVFLCEGEKDADRLASLGLVATTGGAAGVWCDEFSEVLRGRDCVVLQDNDESGEKHVSLVCGALRGIAAHVGSLLLRGLPEKGDVSDWLDAGGQVEMLAELAHAAVLQPPRFQLLTPDELESLPSPEFLASDWLVQGTLSCLYGPSGIGKSFVGLDLVFSIASGAEWLGSIPTVQGPVVYVAAEGVGGLKERMRAWKARHPGADISNVRFLTMAVNLLDINQVKELIDAIRLQFEQPILVVFDTLARSMAGGDENSTKDMNAVISAGDLVRITFGSHVLIVHHTGKNGDQERGSSALRGAVDTSIYLSREDSSITMTCQKQKDAVEPEHLGLKLAQVENTLSCVLEMFDSTGRFTDSARKLLQILADHFPLNEGAATSAWLEVSGMAKETFYRSRKILTDNRCIAKGGKRTDKNMITTEGCRALDIEPLEDTPTVGTTRYHVGTTVPTHGENADWYHGPTPEEWPASGTNSAPWAVIDDD